MKSMTGYGTGDAPLGNGKVHLDVRSVNHRYLDVRVRVPGELAEHSLFLEQRARDRLQRGRYDLAARYEGPAAAPKLDAERFRSAYRELERLRDELSPGAEVPLAALVAMPSLYVAPSGFAADDAQRALGAAFERALAQLDEMRTREGVALTTEIRGRLDLCRRLREELATRVPDAVKNHQCRLRARVQRLLSDVSATVDPGRLEAEIALLADRLDVTEEMVRLDSHFAQFEGLLGGEDSAARGRRMDFLLQEIARETNTVGAKCQDADLGHLVVEMKSEIERMREQVQNVE